MKKRAKPKEEREKEAELLKLEISLLSLKSGFMNRRIQGIKDLSNLSRSIKYTTHKSFKSGDLVKWIKDNKVLELILDPKQTHI